MAVCIGMPPEVITRARNSIGILHIGRSHLYHTFFSESGTLSQRKLGTVVVLVELFCCNHNSIFFNALSSC